MKKIQKAIKFATKTHEIYKKQKRKGKDVAYIVHPLTVALILSSTNAKEEIVIAGILHDTIEDSIEEKKVDFKMIKDRFGIEVANLVLSVTEQDKSLSWEDRKKKAIDHIRKMNNDSLLLKSADIIANTTELLDDYNKEGEKIWLNFNAKKEDKLKNMIKTIGVIKDSWKDNPLAEELKELISKLERK